MTKSNSNRYIIMTLNNKRNMQYKIHNRHANKYSQQCASIKEDASDCPLDKGNNKQCMDYVNEEHVLVKTGNNRFVQATDYLNHLKSPQWLSYTRSRYTQ